MQVIFNPLILETNGWWFRKSPKIANLQISHLIISIGYEIEIREFWLFTRFSILNSTENLEIEFGQEKHRPYAGDKNSQAVFNDSA